MAKNEQATVADEPAATERTVRYVGVKPYGTEFLTSHTLTGADLKRLGDAEATKPTVWGRDNNWSVPAADLHPSVVEALAKDPAFKVVEG